MSLKNILSITGKPGLFKILSANRMPVVVQDLNTGAKRTLFPRDKVVSLADISMYTNEGDKPLGEIFDIIYQQHAGKELDAKNITVSKDTLANFFKQILPSYDEERVYPTDIKKVVQWYNLLVKDGYTSFAEKEETATEIDVESKDEDK